MKDKFKKLFQTENGEIKFKKPSKKTGYLIVIALTGLLLLILGNAFSSPSKETTVNNNHVNNNTNQPAKETISEKKSSTTSNVSELETSYEKDLTEMLEKIQGVSDVEVMVNLDSTNVKVYEKNLISGQQTTDESDKNGGTRKVEDSTEEKEVVLVRQGDKEVPLLTQTKKPEVRGVFVVAKGVDHATVKKWMVEATARVLDVPTHRVSIMPKN
ncbi:stage III sporulation protein AG [Virgibacillus alimentarius]|uniref:stage III sporulation protein AG n=1 Tax=Virgibacillus alimentarius TaxID=698769 RepID=UPI00049315CC|nr:MULTISPECIES: stage III sporulation protein AG [Virgibacillus]HLR66421.1 stage III sporulation protein AG [Virgibacillus sp.]